jgi:hypothetical protein
MALIIGQSKRSSIVRSARHRMNTGANPTQQHEAHFEISAAGCMPISASTSPGIHTHAHTGRHRRSGTYMPISASTSAGILPYLSTRCAFSVHTLSVHRSAAAFALRACSVGGRLRDGHSSR